MQTDEFTYCSPIHQHTNLLSRKEAEPEERRYTNTHTHMHIIQTEHQNYFSTWVGTDEHFFGIWRSEWNGKVRSLRHSFSFILFQPNTIIQFGRRDPIIARWRAFFKPRKIFVEAGKTKTDKKENEDVVGKGAIESGHEVPKFRFFPAVLGSRWIRNLLQQKANCF